MSKSYDAKTPRWEAIKGGTFFLLLGIFLLAATPLSSVAGESASSKKPLEKSFPNSEKCKRCHLRVFEEWEASAQSRSIVTAPFRVTLDQFLASTDEKDHAMCFRCHAPHILEYGDHLSRFIKEVQSKDPQMDGVGCPQCHLIQDVDMKSHPPIPTFQLGTTIFGGYDKAAQNLAHQSQKLDLYRESKFCVTCHDSLPKTSSSAKDLPGWLGSWEKTKAESSGKPCQTCHMPEAIDESANGEKVRKVANHSFPGRFGKVRAEAVTLDFTTEATAATSQVQVSIQSLVPHNLPLPHPGWSRVVVDLSIFGKNLKRVYNEQRFYERIFGNAEGKESVFDFEAKNVLHDTLLKPEEMRIEVFTFPTPQDAPSMDVVVTLTYAPVHGPQDFLDKVEQGAALGKKDKAFQSVQIAQKKMNVPLKK
ncbi:MAG: cytochrome c family protein [Nitrospirota bacterium]|nr:cytochrome c family protein [Nitrospirota bacterium]